MNTGFLGPAVATVLTVYGIETLKTDPYNFFQDHRVATVLTVYGIETLVSAIPMPANKRLQQYLPFTVLKLSQINLSMNPFTLCCNSTYRLRY